MTSVRPSPQQRTCRVERYPFAVIGSDITLALVGTDAFDITPAGTPDVGLLGGVAVSASTLPGRLQA
jgi:hypothetical protein